MVLVTSELLEQFVNTLTADYQYSRWTRENFLQQVPMKTSRKLKTYFRFLISFLKSMLNFKYSEKKDPSQTLSITEIDNCETGSYLNVHRPSFMQRLGRQHVNGFQILLRSARNQFHTTLPLIRDRGTRKRLVLVTSELLKQFVNTFTAD